MLDVAVAPGEDPVQVWNAQLKPISAVIATTSPFARGTKSSSPIGYSELPELQKVASGNPDARVQAPPVVEDL